MYFYWFEDSISLVMPVVLVVVATISSVTAGLFLAGCVTL